MEKIKLGILAIFFIFLIGGSFAIFHENTNISDAPTVEKDIISNDSIEIDDSENKDNIDLQNDDIESYDENPSENNVTKTTYQQVKKYLTPSDFNNSIEYLKYREMFNPDSYGSKENITYKTLPGSNLSVEEADYTDLYLRCPMCGKFLPLGNITKALPDEAICLDGCGASGSMIKEIVLLNAYTYEEADKIWLNEGAFQIEEINDQSNDVNEPSDNHDVTPETNNPDSDDQTENALPSNYVICDYQVY